MDLLKLYQNSSGQRFNLMKSSLFLGKCLARKASMVTGLFHIPQASIPSLYLGVPLFFFVVSDIPILLKCWTTSDLSSKVGRLGAFLLQGGRY